MVGEVSGEVSRRTGRRVPVVSGETSSRRWPAWPWGNALFAGEATAATGFQTIWKIFPKSSLGEEPSKS